MPCSKASDGSMAQHGTPLELPLLLLLKQLVHPLSSLEGKSPGLSERCPAKQSQKASSRMRLEVKVVKVVAKLETVSEQNLCNV